MLGTLRRFITLGCMLNFVEPCTHFTLVSCFPLSLTQTQPALLNIWPVPAASLYHIFETLASLAGHSFFASHTDHAPILRITPRTSRDRRLLRFHLEHCSPPPYYYSASTHNFFCSQTQPANAARPVFFSAVPVVVFVVVAVPLNRTTLRELTKIRTTLENRSNRTKQPSASSLPSLPQWHWQQADPLQSRCLLSISCSQHCPLSSHPLCGHRLPLPKHLRLAHTSIIITISFDSSYPFHNCFLCEFTFPILRERTPSNV